ncbi:hypothetical protein KBI23_03510 [bacterium]|nr:hypothetical protein [bacterium]MBP9810064.1 hypothetical protein [bacterium]
MPQPAQLSKDKKPDKGKAESKAFAPKHFDPIEHGQVKKRGLLFLFCGVILPTIALLFETTFHFCAHNFFDPFPTASHVVLFALIPLSNFLVWLGTRKDLSNHYAFMSLASGMAMGVSCLYSLMFLPLTPISCFFALALGFGLLGLAPLLSVPCNLIAGKTVCRLADRKGTYFNAHQFEHMGHMIILVMVIAIELPSTLTRINLAKAADKNVIESSAGVDWLRRYGSQEVLLRSCYERSGKATDILGSLYESAHHTTIDQNRRVFFKVTGKPYNSVPIPKAARATIQHTGVITDPANLNAGVDDEFDIDTDIAGEEVCGVARGLSASQSEITGNVDPSIALASLDWTIAFTNDSKFNREARAKILLPPHAVTTKATLTINNVERDATIMVRSKARARYRKAVMEKKDPLLVSTCGTDQILVQCYPVQPGQTVTVKLQIAAPMSIPTDKQASLMMPAFLERNFQVDSPVKVDIKSNGPLIAGALKITQAEVAQANEVKTDTVVPDEIKQSYELKGNIENAQLACFDAVISAARNSTNNSVSYAGSELPGLKITRNLRPASYPGINSLLIVIDGSASMQQSFAQIAEALKAIPPSMSVQIKVVGDTTTELYSGLQQGNSGDVLNAAERLKAMKGEGGQDDSATLNDALSLVAMTNRMSVLWIHAAQPMTSESTANVQACLKRSDRPLLFDMQVMAGPNELLNGVNTPKSLVRVERTGDLKTDLVSFFNACSNTSTDTSSSTSPEPEYVFTQGANSNELPSALPGGTGDKRLAQIWANQRIAEDLQNPTQASSSEPGVLAQAFQIISPVSSAIVTDPEEKTLASVAKPKTKFSDRFRKPMGEIRALRRKISEDLNVKANLERNFKSKVDQLNSLSSAASSAQPDQTLSNAPQASYRDKLDNNEQIRAREESKQIAMSPMGGAKDAIGDKGQAERPILQGATNGALPQFYNSSGGRAIETSVGNNDFAREMSSLKKENAAPPSVDGSEISEADESSDPASNAVPNSKTPDANGNFIDANGDTVDADGKPVPEADTWILLSIIGMIFAGTWLNNKKRKAQSS